MSLSLVLVEGSVCFLEPSRPVLAAELAGAALALAFGVYLMLRPR